MRRLAFILLSALLLASAAGCSGDGNSNTSKAPVTHNNISADSSKQAPSSFINEPSAEVVVKSSNQSTSSEKEQVLNEISDEMDSMIDGINQMEDVDDEDLDL